MNNLKTCLNQLPQHEKEKCTIQIETKKVGKGYSCVSITLYPGILTTAIFYGHQITENKGIFFSDINVSFAKVKKYLTETFTEGVIEMPYLCDLTAPGTIYQILFVNTGEKKSGKNIRAVIAARPRNITGKYVASKQWITDLEKSDYGTEQDYEFFWDDPGPISSEMKKMRNLI